MITNLGEFKADLDKCSEELVEGVLATQIFATEAAAEAFRRATPRRKGKAQASIKTGSSRTDGDTIRAKLSAAKPFGVTHAYSALFYVRFVNDGTVNFRGRHMVERAELVVNDILQERLG